MMSDIFSTFDPKSFMSLNPSTNMTIIMSIFIILLIQLPYWSISNRNLLIMASSYMIMYPQLFRTFSKSLKSTTNQICTLFLSIILINLMGLNPYTFSLSSHLIMTLSFGLPLWLMFILSASFKNISATVAHFLPDGAPDWLNPFLVLIESTSVMVRPVTLSFRLAANMSAGHIVLSLISIYGASALLASILPSLSLILAIVGYLMFEMAICLIQAYIFCLLLSLYSNEHPHYLPSTMRVGFDPTSAYIGGRH